MLEPTDASVLKGRTALIDCQADGVPAPSVRWSKTEGKKSSLRKATEAAYRSIRKLCCKFGDRSNISVFLLLLFCSLRSFFSFARRCFVSFAFIHGAVCGRDGTLSACPLVARKQRQNRANITQLDFRQTNAGFKQPPVEFKPVISSPHIRVFENGSLAIHSAQKSDAAFYLCQVSALS